MTYFLPSLIQKRLLRYALSRLELLETDDLALDKLDIAWGRKSTVELRDVGLRLRELSSLLNLPPGLILLKARISLLRLTVPADLYKSSILVEVEGVEVLLKTNAVEKEGRGKPGCKSPARECGEPSKRVKADRPRSAQTLIHDPGGSQSSQTSQTSDTAEDDTSDDEDTHKLLPTTEDLAQSFLQAEPLAEKEGFKAAIAESYNLEESFANSESEDEASTYGIGHTLSLPMFLADFLKGVGDRMKVKIQNIIADLEVSLDLPLGSSAGSTSSDKSDIVTIRLSIEDVDLGGAVPDRPPPHSDNNQPDFKKDAPTEVSSQVASEAHQIILRNIQVMLVSDAVLFANLSRFDIPLSPSTTQIDSVVQPVIKPLRGFSRSTSTTSSTVQKVAESLVIQDDQRNSLTSSTLEASTITSDSDRFADAENENESVEASAPLYASTLEGSRYQDSILADSYYSSDGDQQLYNSYKKDLVNPDHSHDFQSSYQDLPHESSFVEHEGQVRLPAINHRTTETPETIKPSYHSSPIGDAGFDQDSPADAKNVKSGSRASTNEDYESLYMSHEKSRLALSATQENLENTPPEDLTKSKIWSHEEAESMYMSAITHASSDEEKSTMTPEGLRSSYLEAEDYSCAKSSTVDDHKRPSQSSFPYPLKDPIDSLELGRSQAAFRERIQTPKAVLLHTEPLNLSKPNSMEQPEMIPDDDNVHERQDSRSSPGSERSSGRLDSSHLMIKKFMLIDFATLKLPREREQSLRSSQPKPVMNQSTSPSFATSGDVSDVGAGEAVIDGNISGPAKQDGAEIEDRQNPFSCNKFEGVPHQQKFIEVGKLELFGDIGLIKLALLAIKQNLEPQEAKVENKNYRATPTKYYTNFWLRVNKISWKFLDSVREFASTRSSDENPTSEVKSFPEGAEVLLKTTVDMLDLQFRQDESSKNAKLSVGKFSFGYFSDDIISFDSSLKMRESTRDILAPVDSDMVLTMMQTSGSLTVHLTTRPLRFCLDLRRLDETFSWFGGFSSILGLGSSMMSTVTVVNAKPRPVRAPKPRGVHFEPSTGPSTSNTKENHTRKLTIRIGSIATILQGANCTLRIDSSAMKLVSRTEGIGLQVDKLKFAGPFLNQDIGEPSITVNLANVRMEYLSVPKEVDLARLLALLSPSNDRYERDDDILLDTLLRQRRQGGVLRITVENFESHVSKLEQFQFLPDVAEELKKLATVAKYLPEDDRPGILLLGLVRNLGCKVTVNSDIGIIAFDSENLELAHVTLPSLTAIGIKRLRLDRNGSEELLGEAVFNGQTQDAKSPIIMARFIGNEMEPIIKVKVQNLRAEYHVSTIMALMGISSDANTEAAVSEMVSSIATITSPQHFKASRLHSQSSASTHKASPRPKLTRAEIVIRDSVIGLNPRNSPARGLTVLSNAHLDVNLPREDEASAIFEIKKAALMIIDDRKNIATKGASIKDNQIDQVQAILDLGFVPVSYISSAKASLTLARSEPDGEKNLDIEIRDDLLVLESCADSTQTLQSILNGLKPPMPPSADLKYRTEVVPVEDMLASFSGDAFATSESGQGYDHNPPMSSEEGDMVDDEVPQNLEFVSSFYNPDPENFHEGIADSMLDDDLESLAGPPITREIGDKVLLESFQEQYQVAPGGTPLEFQDDHFGSTSTVGGTAHRWDTKKNTYELTNDSKIRKSPLRLRVRDAHIIWNLFDGYDWQNTRDGISKAITEVESKATERLSRQDKRKSLDIEDEEESEIGDFLFNSIYIGIPANRDPRDLARQVNKNLDDLASETGSYAPSSASGSPSRQSHSTRSRGRKLRLTRSKYHKMTFELKGVSADLVIFPTDTEETQSSIDIRVQDLDIFDHVPTSTWKKFATYMHDAGERESGTSMIHIEILNVKPVPSLAASEIILKATILPLRLHVDQDALDFMTRFFEFRDDMTAIQTTASEAAFFQRVEVHSVRLKLDFKPKRVDYAGLRSGRTNEFMNFFILDRADMVLRHVIIYGISGFDKLGKTLNDIWMPDVKQNQLPGVLAGLAPVRSLVNVGSGVRDLVVVPIREYRKDGRIVRSFQKGALAFAKSTTTELVRLGAKLAIGTQTVLQGAEDFLSNPEQQRSDVSAGWEEAELEDEEKTRISLYADQPVGVIQGLRGAYASLERDLLTARDAIIAMPGEVMESSTARGAARAVLRNAPTVILRPAMGVSKAVGQTLMGATNSLDPGNRRRIEDKYKRH